MSKKSNNWLEEAYWDLENANILLRNDRFNTVVFHAQQVAEKAVKALLYFNNIHGWGHSIYSLLEKYRELKEVKLIDLDKKALSLDKHYITTRNPDALPNLAPHKAYSKEEAIAAIKQAEDIITFVETEIKKG